VETYDASKRQNFNTRAALVWIVNDFLAYEIVLGWSTKRKLVVHPVINWPIHLGCAIVVSRLICATVVFFVSIIHGEEKKIYLEKVEKEHQPRPFSGDDILLEV